MGVGVGGVVNYANVSSGTASDVVAYGGIGGPYEYVSFFSVLNWFSKGEQGAWYDPSDLTTLFQDSAGTTPVTLSPMEQPVGLMLDKSKGLALGAELYSTTGWTLGTNWSFSGQNLVYSGVAGDTASSGLVLQPNSWYKITITNSAPVRVYTGLSTQFLFAGTTTFYSLSTYTSYSFVAQNNAVTISNISVKQIAGNHAFQATAANRPLLSARVNLLTKTEDFSDAVWGKSNVTVTSNTIIAPDGTLTADKIIPNIVNSVHNVSAPGGYTYGASVTVTIYAKAAEYNFVAIIVDNLQTRRIFDLSGSGTVGVSGGLLTNTATITSIGNNWCKCDMTFTSTAVGNLWIAAQTSNTDLQSFAGDGTSGIYVWGADLRPTNSGALLPAYQRVNTASDYDTVGFPLYLKCNGSSSAMSTNSINFTATDKMTVVTGVRKLSDSAVGNMIVELSANNDSNSGAFRIETGPVANAYRTQLGDVVARKIYDGTTYAPPTSNVLTSQMAFSPTNLLVIRVNGTLPTTLSKPYDNNLQTINFGNYPIYLLARFNGASKLLEGNFYGAIIRGAQSDTNSVVQTEQYMAKQTGITF